MSLRKEVVLQSPIHPSFWVLRIRFGPAQVLVTDDFGNLVAVDHEQFRVSTQ